MHRAVCTAIKAEPLIRPETIVWRSGIIGGLMAYIIINGANFLLDKVAECMHWSIAGSDTQPLSAGSGSFISRLQSNTGGAAQVSTLPPPTPSVSNDAAEECKAFVCLCQAVETTCAEVAPAAAFGCRWPLASAPPTGAAYRVRGSPAMRFRGLDRRSAESEQHACLAAQRGDVCMQGGRPSPGAVLRAVTAAADARAKGVMGRGSATPPAQTPVRCRSCRSLRPVNHDIAHVCIL